MHEEIDLMREFHEIAAEKRSFATDRFGSTSDLQRDAQPAGDAGQVVRRAWSAVLAIIGQQAGNLHLQLRLLRCEILNRPSSLARRGVFSEKFSRFQIKALFQQMLK